MGWKGGPAAKQVHVIPALFFFFFWFLSLSLYLALLSPLAVADIYVNDLLFYCVQWGHLNFHSNWCIWPEQKNIILNEHRRYLIVQLSVNCVELAPNSSVGFVFFFRVKLWSSRIKSNRVRSSIGTFTNNNVKFKYVVTKKY